MNVGRAESPDPIITTEIHTNYQSGVWGEMMMEAYREKAGGVSSSSWRRCLSEKLERICCVTHFCLPEIEDKAQKLNPRPQTNFPIWKSGSGNPSPLIKWKKKEKEERRKKGPPPVFIHSLLPPLECEECHERREKIPAPRAATATVLPPFFFSHTLSLLWWWWGSLKLGSKDGPIDVLCS